MPELVGLDQIRAARTRLAPIVQATPLQPSRAVSSLTGAATYLKCEHLQRTGSFKVRGAYNRIVTLSQDERDRGVVCASAGNHAQGVALSAQLTGASARVFMPAGAPLPKVEATLGYGAQVTLVDGGVDVALDAAATHGREAGATLVHPFEHPDVIAGQGTLGLDVLDELPGVGTVVVPVGGGGLISGVAAAIKALSPATRVIGVQSDQAAAVPASVTAGHPVQVTVGDTIADGIAVSQPGELTLAHISALVDDVVTTSDESIVRAVLLLAERAKQVVEPSGAAGLAALLWGEISDLVEPVVVLLCGGNVDPLLLARIIQSGLTSEGRHLELRTRLPDRPGVLSALLGEVAAAGANIVAIEHHRMTRALGLFEVELQLAVETRGVEHGQELVTRLRAAGYRMDV